MTEGKIVCDLNECETQLRTMNVENGKTKYNISQKSEHTYLWNMSWQQNDK